jgi:hypothetical protein
MASFLAFTADCVTTYGVVHLLPTHSFWHLFISFLITKKTNTGIFTKIWTLSYMVWTLRRCMKTHRSVMIVKLTTKFVIIIWIVVLLEHCYIKSYHLMHFTYESHQKAFWTVFVFGKYRFKSRLGYRLSWLTFLAVFFIFRCKFQYKTSIRPRQLLRNLCPVYNTLIILSSAV